MQEKLLDSITLPYAILFQEFHQVHMTDETWPNYDRIGVASALRRLWVICSFLLVISFAGNLKATSVVKTLKTQQTLSRRSGRGTLVLLGLLDQNKDFLYVCVTTCFFRGLTVLMSSDFYFFTVRTTKSLQATTGTPVLETHREMSKIAEETNGIYSLQWGKIIRFSLCTVQ